VVSAAGSSVALSSSGTIRAGESVTFSATVSSVYGTPTGAVSFLEGAHLLGMAPLVDGVASFRFSGLSVGTHGLTARYEGGMNWEASSSSVLNALVTAAVTGVRLSSSGAVHVGESVTLTATVSSTVDTPAGTVSFLEGGNLLGTATLMDGVASFNTSTLSVGSHLLTARYEGATNWESSTSDAALSVVSAALSSVALSSTGGIHAGEGLTLTATVSSSYGTPTGTVSFLSGTTILGSSTLSNGVATFSTTSLPAGTAILSARYEGDAITSLSSSTSLNQVVAPAMIVLSSSLTPMSLPAGFSGTAEFSANQLGVLSGPVTFTVSGLPEGITCTFSRNEIPVAELPATIQVQVKTTKGFQIIGEHRRGLGGGALLACGFLFVPFSRRKKNRMMFLSGLLAVMVGGMLACGGGSSTSSSNLTTGKTGTPLGTYAVTITATANGADAVSTTLQLTVTP